MFNIQIPVPCPKKAFDMLASCIGHLNWYIANNRSNRLDFYKALNNPLIDLMCEDRNLSRAQMQQKYLERFTNELYDPALYTPAIEHITSLLPQIQSCYPRFEALHHSWGFKIMSHYQIDLDAFSMGGRYHTDDQKTGYVIIGTNKKHFQMAALIVHEMVHLGIENLIINPENLKNPPVLQEEKERIVDNLCIFAMDGLIEHVRYKDEEKLSSYQKVANHCAYMDIIVGNQPETNLVRAVQKFLKEKNRS